MAGAGKSKVLQKGKLILATIIRKSPFATHQGQVFCCYTCFVPAFQFARIMFDWLASATRLRSQIAANAQPAYFSWGNDASVICTSPITIVANPRQLRICPMGRLWEMQASANQ